MSNKRKMLDHWAAQRPTYIVLQEFIEFAQSKGYWLESESRGMANFDKLAYEFLKVDAAQLERERRALLDLTQDKIKAK